MNNLIGIFILLIFIINVFVFCAHVAIESEFMSEDRKTVVLGALIKVIKGWFTNRNLFGTVLSMISVIAVIPGMLLILFVELCAWLLFLIVSIWNLGKKNSK